MIWHRHPAMPEVAVATAFVVGGLAVAERGWAYSVGSITSIGPGFFPFGLGLLLAALGAIHLLMLLAAGRNDTGEGEADPFPWRPALMIAAGMAAWVVMLKPAGLIPATVALVVLTSLSESPFRPLTVLISAVVLPAATALLFIYVLQMPLAAVAW